MRDEYAVSQFETSGLDVFPLYADDPRQMPFVNAENQVEERWVVDVVMQANPTVQTVMQFMGSAGPVNLYP